MKKIVSFAFCFSLLTCPVPSAVAKNFREREVLRALSKTNGIPLPSVDVITVESSSTRSPSSILGKARSASLLGGPAVRTLVKGNLTTFVGDNWRMEVANDGTAATLRRLAPPSNCRRVFGQERPSNAVLEAVARTLISEHLADLVGLVPGDVLVPYKTRHELRASKNPISGDALTERCASSVVFSRRVGGVDVIGTGSKVQVTIDPDGKIVGWSFDWPRYKQGPLRQEVLNIQQIKKRAAAAGVNLDDTSSETSSMECGLYDPGFRHREPSMKIQAACTVYSKYYDPSSREKLPVSASMTTVPIGLEVFDDRARPPTQ